jgi:DNA-binding transcriptional ArsR family regulator
MKDGPDISRIGALIGDPARASMLAVLMDGRALTAAELAEVAGITPQTASSHLAKLEHGGLVQPQKQGRHKYFSLSGPAAAGVLESLMDFAAERGHMRHRPGPRDEAMRKARVCYDHLAGAYGVRMLDSLVSHGHLGMDDGRLGPTEHGKRFFSNACIAVPQPSSSHRPLCRYCLDWSERRDHLAGALGATLYSHILDQGWAKRDPSSRAITFTSKGETAFKALFCIEA